MTDAKFQAANGQARYYSVYEGKETTDGKEETAHSTDCTLLLSDACLSSFQYSSSEPDKNMEHTWANKYRPNEQEADLYKGIIRHHLKSFNPLSLYLVGGGHSFSNADYLWNPPIGTKMEQFVEEGDDVVLTLKISLVEGNEETLTLRFDRKNHWSLREAKCVETDKDGSHRVWSDLREYDSEQTDFPITKKRLVETTYTDSEGNVSQLTEEMELKRLDLSPIADTVFLPSNMPIDTSPLLPKDRIPYNDRLQRHLNIAALWFTIPLIVIFTSRSLRRRKASAT